MEGTTASTGQAVPIAHLAELARTSTPIASAATCHMGLGPASSDSDPRMVVTPLDHHQVEDLLCKYGILDNWLYILDGIRNSFNVGISNSPSSTHMF